MRRLAAGLGIACLVGVCSPALAAEPPVVGWWYEPQQIPAAVPVDLPAPPYVPAGDLLVEGSSTGPDAVSALRFLLPQGQDAGTLTVPVVSSRGTVALEVCATLSGWAPVQVGDWGARPVCGGKAVPMVLSKDGTSVSAPVRALEKDGVVDVLLEPGVDPTTGAQLATSVTLAPKAVLTTTTTAVAVAPVPQTPEPVTSEPAPALAPPVVAPPAAGPVLPGVVAPVTAPTGAPAQPTPQVAVPAAPQALPRKASSSTRGRSAALLLLLLTALTSALLTRRSRTGTELGGVGRYRTARTGTPAVRL